MQDQAPLPEHVALPVCSGFLWHAIWFFGAIALAVSHSKQALQWHSGSLRFNFKSIQSQRVLRTAQRSTAHCQKNTSGKKDVSLAPATP